MKIYPLPPFSVSASINCLLTLWIKQEYLNTLKIDFFCYKWKYNKPKNKEKTNTILIELNI